MTLKLGLSVGFIASINATLYFSEASIITRASFAFDAIGFSQSTCLPWLMHSTLWAACMKFGEAIYTASINGDAAISSSDVKVNGMLCLFANASAVLCSLEHTAVRLKRLSCLAPAISQPVIKFVPTTPNRISAISPLIC